MQNHAGQFHKLLCRVFSTDCCVQKKRIAFPLILSWEKSGNAVISSRNVMLSIKSLHKSLQNSNPKTSFIELLSFFHRLLCTEEKNSIPAHSELGKERECCYISRNVMLLIKSLHKSLQNSSPKTSFIELLSFFHRLLCTEKKNSIPAHSELGKERECCYIFSKCHALNKISAQKFAKQQSKNEFHRIAEFFPQIVVYRKKRIAFPLILSWGKSGNAVTSSRNVMLLIKSLHKSLIITRPFFHTFKFQTGPRKILRLKALTGSYVFGIQLILLVCQRVGSLSDSGMSTKHIAKTLQAILKNSRGELFLKINGSADVLPFDCVEIPHAVFCKHDLAIWRSWSAASATPGPPPPPPSPSSSSSSSSSSPPPPPPSSSSSAPPPSSSSSPPPPPSSSPPPPPPSSSSSPPPSSPFHPSSSSSPPPSSSSPPPSSSSPSPSPSLCPSFFASPSSPSPSPSPVWYNGQELTEVAGARLAVAVDASAGPRGLRLSCKSTTNTSEWGSAAGTVRSNAGGVWALGLTTDNPPSGWPTSAFDMVANAFAPPTFTAGSLLVDVLDSSADTAWPADNRYGYFLFGTPSPSCSPSPSVTPTISLTASSSVPPSISPTASPSSSRAASVSTSPVPSTTTSASASAVSPSVTSSVSLTASQSSVSLTASVTQSISESSSQSSSPSAVSTSISISPSRCPPCPHLAIPHGDDLDPSFQSLSTSVVSASASRSLSASASRSASRSPVLCDTQYDCNGCLQGAAVVAGSSLSRLSCGVKTRLTVAFPTNGNLTLAITLYNQICGMTAGTQYPLQRTLTTFTKADDYCEIMFTTDAGFHLTPSCFMTLSFSLVLAAWLL
eukprot:g65856.t1